MYRPRARTAVAQLVIGLSAPVAAWAFFCPDSLSSDDVEMVLLGEQLLIDAEDAGAGMVLGTYRSSDGYVVNVQCTGGTGHHDMLGEFA